MEFTFEVKVTVQDGAGAGEIAAELTEATRDLRAARPEWQFGMFQLVELGGDRL